MAIQGEDDPYGSIAQVDAIRDGKKIAVDVRMIADCGHAPHLERGDHVLPIIGEFVTHANLAMDSAAIVTGT
jgi:pimeloyl-ACP methyl ester carboxylesterase